LLTVTILFAVSSCKPSGDKGNNNEINNGGNGDKFSTDALWDNGSTVNFYSSAELYSDIDESGLFPALQNDAGIRARWYENQLKGISSYGGQQLEIDWKTDTRKLCDITFRALLIMHYAGKLKGENSIEEKV